MRTCGAALTVACAISATGLIRCSQLSRMSSTRARLQVRAQRVQRRATRLLGHVEHANGFAGDQRRVAQRRQVQEPHAVRVQVQLFGRHLQRQPRLAQPAHAEQRDQPRLLQRVLDLVQLAFAADERAALVRQVVGDVLDRHPPVAGAHDAKDLLAVRGRDEACFGVADLEDLDRFGHALDQPVTVRLQLQRRLAEVVARFGGEQRLAATRQRHDACGGRLGQAVDLQRLRAARDVVGIVLAQDHRPDVQPGSRLQRHRHRRQRPVVGERVPDRLRGIVEQQQHAVGLVDLAPVPLRQQVARDTVVRRPDLGHRRIAERLGQLGAVDDIGEQ